jgi:predicted kinase
MAEAAQQLPGDDWKDIHPAEMQTSPYAHGDDWHDIAPPASLDEFAGPKITETPLYKAGEAVQKFGRETFPVSEEERVAHPYASAIGRGVGSMLPAAVGALVAGPAGALAGATQMGMGAGADTFDDALAKGADEKTASKAAGIDSAIAMALGSVDLGAVIAPIKRSLPGWSGWAAQKIAQAGRSGLTFMGVGQAQQYLNTEVEKELYNPDARYSPELKDMLASFVVGGAFGTMHPLRRPGQEAPGQPAEVPPLEGEVLPPARGPTPSVAGREAPTIEGEAVGAPSPAEGHPEGLPPPARALPPPAEAAPVAMPQEAGAEEQGYVDQAMRNLRATSRTAAGILDLSSTKGKEEKMVVGLTPQDAARAATTNYEGLVRDLYNGRNDLPQDGAGMAQFIDGVAERVNQGIVKPGELQRTADTKFANQTLAADLPLAHRQFSEELAQRLADPNADPVETAAWIEWRSNLMDHFWSDGVGKASKALAAVPLMRAGLPLPLYPPNKDLFAFTSGLPRVDPNEGGEAYLGPRWEGFNALYHDMVYPRESLKAALDRDAPLDELVQHPYVRHVDEQNKKAVPTGTDEDFANPEWRAQRVYDFSAKEFGTAATTEPVRGWDAAVERLTDRAKLYAGPEGGDNGNHAIIILGPPAAGKSGTAEPLARAFRAAIVDADDAKLAIPEYQGGLGTHAVHEESSAMSKDVAVGLLADGANVILPKVGQTETSIRRAMQGLREMGYKVDLVHVAATPEISGRRNIKRMLDTGRLVAPEYIAEIGDKPRETYHLLKGEANDFADINTAVQPRETREASPGLAHAFTDGRHIVSGLPAGGGRGEAAPRAEEAQIGQIGHHRVTAADGTAIDVAPRVVEAGHVLTSQDQGYDPSLQPRQRSRAASQAQVRDIATNLDPERLGYSAEADRGAPIIGPDGMVESGNGRVLALRRVYERGGSQAQAYRDWLSRQGVDVSKFRNPILVRQRTTPFTPEQRRAFTVAANQPTTLSMSASELAMADARLIDAGSLNLIVNPDDLSRNRDFVRRFIGQLPQTEQGAMADTRGALSSEGATRIRNAVLAKAYGDAGVLTRIAESTNDEIKSISNALVGAAPRWAKMRAGVESGTVRRDVDLTPDLIEAVKRTADIRAKGHKLNDYLAQQDAFDKLPDTVESFMRNFYDPKGRRAASAERIKDMLRFYADEASKVSADKGLDLGLVKVEPRDILSLAQKKGWSDGRQGRDAERGGVGTGSREPAGGAQAPGPFLTAGGEGLGGEGAEGDQEAAVRAQRPERPRDLIAEREREGQFGLSDAERISSAQLAQRRADEPLRPRVAQEPPSGLFAHQGQQLSLEDFLDHVSDVKAQRPEAQVDTPEFKRWFGNSKVTTVDGAPLRAFHGTTKEFYRFNTQPNSKRTNKNNFGELGSWFSAPSKGDANYDEGNAEYVAGSFTEGRNFEPMEGARIIPAYLSIKNPMEFVDYEELQDAVREAGSTKKLRDQIEGRGHDGIVIRDSDTDGSVYRDDWVAFHPEQIKSATGNRGTFDPTSADIRAQREETRSPPFYSAVERAVASAKQEKASPQQWLGMLKNMPGVKPEEMQWLGLEDWLKGQKGPVTKAQIADYVRANQIEVRDVEKAETPQTAKGVPVHVVDLTDKLKDVVTQEGFPLFKAPGGWESAEGRSEPQGQKIRIGRDTYAYVNPKYSAKEQEIANAVMEIGARMAPKANVKGVAALRMSGSPIWGGFINSAAFPQLITWSLERGGAGQIGQTVRHEIIHHLRNMGLFSPDEWKALRDAAVHDGWLQRHNIYERYPDLSADHKVEEAVAEQFGKWRAERSLVKPGPIRDAFMRFELFLRRVAAAVRKAMGFNATPSDIFTRIETGEVGRREPIKRASGGRVEVGKRGRDSFGYMEPSPNIPDFAQCGSCQIWIKDRDRCYWFSDTKEVEANDSCTEYVQGEPIKGNVKATNSLDPKEAGFIKGSTRCENCVSFNKDKPLCMLFEKLNRTQASIFDLDEKVKPRGCCNAFARDSAKHEKIVRRANGGCVDARNINHKPTPAQQATGIYAKDHLHRHGLPITIENAKGSIRRGVGKDGKPWQARLGANYGYLKRSQGADGDHLDVYLGDHPKSEQVFIVDQVDADSGKWDEHKVFLSFANKAQALRAYERSFSDGKAKDRIGHITEMTMDQFRHWLENGDTKKPLKGTSHAPKVDTAHDCAWMSEMSKNGEVFYRDRSLPSRIINNSKWLPVDEPLKRHEVAEYNAIKKMVEEFEQKHGRKPNDAEREAIYLKCHKEHGEVAEHAYLRENGYDVKAWESWCRGKLAHLEHKRIAKPVPNPHVRPSPHDRRRLETTL